EYGLQVLRSNADSGVLHLEADLRRRQYVRAQANTAAIGKFDGVVQQVQQHLPQALFIAVHDVRQALRQFTDKLQAFQLRLDAHDVDERLQKLRQCNFGRQEIQLARLDFRQVQQIVDQCEQVLATLPDGHQTSALLRIE